MFLKLGWYLSIRDIVPFVQTLRPVNRAHSVLEEPDGARHHLLPVLFLAKWAKIPPHSPLLFLQNEQLGPNIEPHGPFDLC